LDVGTAEFAFPERCPAVGQVVEKKRLHWAYTVNGSDMPVGSLDPLVKLIAVALGAVCIVWDVLSSVRRRRSTLRR